MSSSMNMYRQKADLRREISAVLKKLSKEDIRKRSLIITDQVLSCPAYCNAQTVSTYLNFGTEVETHAIVSTIFQQHKQCFVPRFKFGSNDMEMVKLRSLDHYENLPVNKWNIKEPMEDGLESVFDGGSLDLVIVPGLGFTEDGKRLGRGKGYYDRFLTKCLHTFKKYPYTIGLALKEQIMFDIPMAENDVKLDMVIFA